jgi:F-box and WD-40 domain protein 1/11
MVSSSISSTTWHKLRQAASFRHTKNRSVSCIEDPSDSPWSDEPTAPIPGNGKEPPYIPRGSGGAAARANAAAQNELFGRMRHLSIREDNQADRESGVHISLENSNSICCEDSDSAISRVNFLGLLPVELTEQILAHLDLWSLFAVESVSKQWHQASRSAYVWREVFCAEKSNTYAMSGRVSPGTGLGIPKALPTKYWKNIYKLRHQLDENWKSGIAKPVYLNGHMDSIYCIQFDE